MKKILIILGLIVFACIIAASCGKDEPTNSKSDFRFEYNVTVDASRTNLLNSLKTGLDGQTVMNDKDYIITQADRLIEGFKDAVSSASGTITLYQGKKIIKTWTL